MPIRFINILLCLALAAAPLCAEEKEPRLPLDVLLETPISTAAKYDQQLSSVAASVTIVTAEEIERYGWSTLDDVIQAVRGMYLTNSRTYSNFGIRGIGRSDSNVRILMLLDGHAMNGAIWGEGATAGALALDLEVVERIEVVRGPASALYGSHAMLAVINVITKNFDASEGLALSAAMDSRGNPRLSFRSGRELRSGVHLNASAHWSSSEGRDLFYPEFAEPGVSDGIARNRDYEELFNAAVTLEKGALRASLSTRSRSKGIPTASYGSDFNADSYSVDRRDMATVSYDRSTGRGKRLELRGYWDQVRYRADWWYEDVLGVEHSDDEKIGGEARFHWDIRANQRLTAGTEVAEHTRADYHYVVGDYAIDLGHPFRESSFYVQHEYHPTGRLGFVTGIRHDRFSNAPSTTNPRAAILFQPSRDTTFKLLYGTAFLAPNLYQAYFADPETPWKMNPSLGPETMRTLELVWEQRMSPELLLVGSVYRIAADSLIEVEVDPADSTYWYRNRGMLRSTGVELGADWRRPDGLWSHFSYAAQHAHGADGRLDNSPHHIVKAGLSSSPWKPMHAGIEAMYESARATRNGARTDPSFLLNGVVSRQLGPRVRASLSVRNLLDIDYAHPAGAHLRPDTIGQDGRTFTATLSYQR